MNRLRIASARTATDSIALVAIVALSLAGCSSDTKPTAKASSGSASSSSSPGDSSAASKDESAAVLGWTPPAPVAKTEGRLATFTFAKTKQPSDWDGMITVPATAEVISVQAGDTSTILTWQLSSTTDSPLQGGTLNERTVFYPDAVRLVDPAGGKSYAANMMKSTDANLINNDPMSGPNHCVCSAYPIHVGPDPVRMTAEYPPLSATATSVSVRIPNFASVTVPVTRY